MSFLGLLGSPPAHSNSWELNVSPAEGEIENRTTQIESFLSDQRISHVDLQKLIDGISLARSVVSGKCDCALIRPLYIWLYAAYFPPLISEAVAEILRWWIRPMRSFRPRVVSFRPRPPDYIIFTDASYRGGNGEIAAFYIDGMSL